MRPEVAGAFRLAMRHEDLADRIYPRYRWDTRSQKRRQRHFDKAEKLYARAARLERKVTFFED